MNNPPSTQLSCQSLAQTINQRIQQRNIYLAQALDLLMSLNQQTQDLTILSKLEEVQQLILTARLQ